MLQGYVPVLGALILSLCLEVVGQQTIAKRCETLTTFPPASRRQSTDARTSEDSSRSEDGETGQLLSLFWRPRQTAQLDLRDWLWYGLKNAVRHLRNIVPSCSRRAKW
jgi:hypothetical protein